MHGVSVRRAPAQVHRADHRCSWADVIRTETTCRGLQKGESYERNTRPGTLVHCRSSFHHRSSALHHPNRFLLVAAAFNIIVAGSKAQDVPAPQPSPLAGLDYKDEFFPGAKYDAN